MPQLPPDPANALATAFGPDGAPTDGIVLHPRAYVTLKTIVDGNTLDTGFVPHHVAHRRGSHNKADEVEVDIEGAVLPWPIRLIGGSFCCVYMGVVQDPQDPDEIKQDRNLRFCGYFDDVDQDLGKRVVKFKAQDLSRPLREHRPLVKVPVNGIIVDPTPRYSDTLEQAIRRILSVVPGWDDAKVDAPLDVRQNAALSTGPLASLVTGRAKNGPVTLKSNCSAWEAIETVCAIASRHVGVELREIVVRTAAEVFQDADPDPEQRINFIVGVENANAFPPTFHKKFTRNRKGVKVIAFDTEQRKQVSAVYPDDSFMTAFLPRRRPAPKKVASSRTAHAKKQQELKPPQRDVYELDPGAYTPAALLEQAKKIWLERATQEADGRIATPLWNEQLLSKMKNGARFFVKISLDLERKLREIGDDRLASKFLQEQYPGLDQASADGLLAALRKPLQDFWYCKNVTFEWPGAALCNVEFINLVEI